jgi:hypothetical protein
MISFMWLTPFTAEHLQSNYRHWHPTLTSTEHGGSERTAVYGCAHFDGSGDKF